MSGDPFRPFSNGTEGDMWMGAWCNHCKHDHESHEGRYENGCGLIAAVYLGQMPEGWIVAPEGTPNAAIPFLEQTACLRFDPCEPCGGDHAPEQRVEIVERIKAAWEASRG